MSQTQAQLITSVLEDLSVIGIGENAATADTTLVTTRYTTVVTDLDKRRIYTVTDTNAIANEAYPHMVRIVAELCAPSFGRDTKVDLITASEAALASITRLSRTSSYATTTAEVFDRLSAAGKLDPAIDATVVVARTTEVLADLSARRVATIANEAAVTDAQRSHVALLVAALCAPGAFPPAMLEQATAALAAISRYAASGLTKSVLEQLETWGTGTLTVDATLVATRIPAWLEDLTARGIIMAYEEADIPTAAMPHLVRWAAAQLAPKPAFDVMEQAERRMREQTRRGYRPPFLTFEPVLKARGAGGTYGW